jgi:hypothetical protein
LYSDATVASIVVKSIVNHVDPSVALIAFRKQDMKMTWTSLALSLALAEPRNSLAARATDCLDMLCPTRQTRWPASISACRMARMCVTLALIEGEGRSARLWGA